MKSKPPNLKQHELSGFELDVLTQSIIDDVRRDCGNTAVDKFYSSNRNVAHAFIRNTWLRIRLYLYREQNRLWKDAATTWAILMVMAFFVGMCVGLALAKL